MASEPDGVPVLDPDVSGEVLGALSALAGL
jgi:hypothetical protein